MRKPTSFDADEALRLIRDTRESITAIAARLGVPRAVLYSRFDIATIRGEPHAALKTLTPEQVDWARKQLQAPASRTEDVAAALGISRRTLTTWISARAERRKAKAPPRSKVTPEQCAEARRALSAGETRTAVAAALGVTRTTLRLALRAKPADR